MIMASSTTCSLLKYFWLSFIIYAHIFICKPALSAFFSRISRKFACYIHSLCNIYGYFTITTQKKQPYLTIYTISGIYKCTRYHILRHNSHCILTYAGRRSLSKRTRLFFPSGERQSPIPFTSPFHQLLPSPFFRKKSCLIRKPARRNGRLRSICPGGMFL